jgi:hypothetical protein
MFDNLLRSLLEKAKTNRQKLGYRDAHKFAQCAIVIGPRGEQAVLPVQWKSNREKHIVMEALSIAARKEGAAAIVLISDARWTMSDKFSAYFHLPDPKEIGLDAWQKEYLSILKGIYGGEMEQLPRELWDEAVIVGGKGPLVGEHMQMARYREGRNDSVEWINEPFIKGSESESYQVQFNMLPDWWETTTQ